MQINHINIEYTYNIEKNTNMNGPTLLEAALMAQDVYRNDNDVQVPLLGGWKRTAYEKGEFVEWGLYRRNINGHEEYVYATAGTNDLGDVFSDMLQLTGLSVQYRESVAKACAISAEHNKEYLIFIGHSLGGGLATINALKTGREAITFNPANLSIFTKWFMGVWSKSAEKIKNIIVSGEAVSNTQKNFFLKPCGKIIWLKPDKKIINQMESLTLHKIESVIKKLRDEKFGYVKVKIEGFAETGLKEGARIAKNGIDSGCEITKKGFVTGYEKVSESIDTGRKIADDTIDKGREIVSGSIDNGREIVGKSIDAGNEFIEKGKSTMSEMARKSHDFGRRTIDRGTDLRDHANKSASVTAKRLLANGKDLRRQITKAKEGMEDGIAIISQKIGENLTKMNGRILDRKKWH
jgi:hypothetical protein